MSDGPDTQRLTHAEQRELGKQAPLDARTLNEVVERLTDEFDGTPSFADAIEIVDEMLTAVRQGRCR